MQINTTVIKLFGGSSLLLSVYATAQPSFDAFVNFIPDMGDEMSSSAGLRVMSPGIELGETKNDRQPLELRIGAEVDFFFGTTERITGVPLASPQSGFASVDVTNNLFRPNLVARVSQPYKKVFSPYADVFVGGRFYSTNTSVDPYSADYSSSSSLVYKRSCMNIGAGLGFILGGESVKLDAGINFSFAGNRVKIVDLNNLKVSGNALVLERRYAPVAMPMAHVGLTVVMNERFGRFMEGCFNACGSIGGCFFNIFGNSSCDSNNDDDSNNHNNNNNGGSKTPAKVNVIVK